MVEFQTFIGGLFDTNAYMLQTPQGDLLVDAPTGVLDWALKMRASPKILLLTHGHIDHIDGAAQLKQHFNCKIVCHQETVPLITDPDFFKKFGFPVETETVKPDILIGETSDINFLGIHFQTFYVPGHCPGSLCFYLPESKMLFAGDTLFANSIGRTDLPGGDFQLLYQGIRQKLFTLPPETNVYSGHGPATTIGFEKETNPFLQARPTEDS
jgi:hydroxyacylglutathione hydrolase